MIMDRLVNSLAANAVTPQHFGEWVQRWGPPAIDLTWSHAMYVVLAIEIEERERLHRDRTGEADSRSLTIEVGEP